MEVLNDQFFNVLTFQTFNRSAITHSCDLTTAIHLINQHNDFID